MITEQEIDKLEACRETDVLMAQVAGWQWVTNEDGVKFLRHPDRFEYGAELLPLGLVKFLPSLPYFSTDIAALFDVLEDIFPWPECQVEIRTDVNGNWRTCITYVTSSSMFVGVDKSICVAIDRAVLKAAIR